MSNQEISIHITCEGRAINWNDFFLVTNVYTFMTTDITPSVMQQGMAIEGHCTIAAGDMGLPCKVHSNNKTL